MRFTAYTPQRSVLIARTNQSAACVSFALCCSSLTTISRAPPPHLALPPRNASPPPHASPPPPLCCCAIPAAHGICLSRHRDLFPWRVMVMVVVQDKYGYERDLMAYLADLVVACDRRVSLSSVHFFALRSTTRSFSNSK